MKSLQAISWRLVAPLFLKVNSQLPSVGLSSAAFSVSLKVRHLAERDTHEGYPAAQTNASCDICSVFRAIVRCVGPCAGPARKADTAAADTARRECHGSPPNHTIATAAAITPSAHRIITPAHHPREGAGADKRLIRVCGVATLWRRVVGPHFFSLTVCSSERTYLFAMVQSSPSRFSASAISIA